MPGADLTRRASGEAALPQESAPIYSTSVVPPGRNKFGRGYAKNLPRQVFFTLRQSKEKML